MNIDELEVYERVVSDRLYDGTYIKRIVLKLIKEVRKLEKEADWFAMHITKTQPMLVYSEKKTAEMWRKAARQAVEASNDK